MDKVISCIVLAAGAGRRMAYKENKIFIPLGRYSIIQRTLQNVANLQGLSEIILVVADGEHQIQPAVGLGGVVDNLGLVH